jgi:[ribosomal protein S5]-alanine N-acetyltransferase
MAELLTTVRLMLRDWTLEDAPAALEVYGDPEVSRWLVPAIGNVPDEAAMRTVLDEWIRSPVTALPPCGFWAVVRRDDQSIVGGMSLSPLPPADEDIEVGWQLARPYWGHGYAREAAHALAEWAFTQGLEEMFAVMRPRNTRAVALARRLGMEWTGETEKYYGLRLDVYRLRPENLGKTRIDAVPS